MQRRRRIKTETGFITKAAKTAYHSGNYAIQRDKVGNYYIKNQFTLIFKSVNNLLRCSKSPIRVVVMNHEKNTLSTSLTKHMDEICNYRGNIYVFYALYQSEGFVKLFPLDASNNRKEQLSFTPW